MHRAKKNICIQMIQKLIIASEAWLKKNFIYVRL